MKKISNENVVLAGIFSIFTFIIALVSSIYIVRVYPVNLYGILIFSSSLLLLLSSAFLVSGIFFSKKGLISLSGIFVSLYTVSSCLNFLIKNIFSGIYRTAMFMTYGFSLLNTILLMLPLISFIAVTLYSFGLIKNKKIVLFSLFVSWAILFLIIPIHGFSAEIFMITSYILLLKYINISDVSTPVKMGEVFSLSIVTFGVYYILWTLKTVKKTEYFLKKSPSLSEMICFILFSPYIAFWFYTRYEDLNYEHPEIKNRGVFCFVLSILFLSPLSICILQRDLNTLALNEVVEEVEDVEVIPSVLEEVEEEEDYSLNEIIQEENIAPINPVIAEE